MEEKKIERYWDELEKLEKEINRHYSQLLARHPEDRICWDNYWRKMDKIAKRLERIEREIGIEESNFIQIF